MTSTIASVELLLVGGPTVRLVLAGTTFLTDPTFDDPRRYDGPTVLEKLTPAAATAAQVGPVDAVLLSHDQHADNLDEGGRALLPDVPRVLSTQTAAGRIEGVEGLFPWDTTTVGDVSVTAVPALHGPRGAEALAGPVVGFVLETDGLRVHVSGDNASVDVARGIAERVGPVDLVLLHVGAANTGRFGPEPVTLDAERAVEVARAFQGATIVPIHAEGWAHFREGVAEVRDAFAAAGLGDRLLELERGVEQAVPLG